MGQCCARTFTCVYGVCVFLCAVLCVHVHMCALCVCFCVQCCARTFTCVRGVCVSVCSVVRARSHVCVVCVRAYMCECMRCVYRLFFRRNISGEILLFSGKYFLGNISGEIFPGKYCFCSVVRARSHVCVVCVCARTCVNACDVCIDYFSGKIFTGEYFRENISGEILLLQCCARTFTCVRGVCVWACACVRVCAPLSRSLALWAH